MPTPEELICRCILDIGARPARSTDFDFFGEPLPDDLDLPKGRKGHEIHRGRAPHPSPRSLLPVTLFHQGLKRASIFATLGAPHHPPHKCQKEKNETKKLWALLRCGMRYVANLNEAHKTDDSGDRSSPLRLWRSASSSGGKYLHKYRGSGNSPGFLQEMMMMLLWTQSPRPYIDHRYLPTS